MSLLTVFQFAPPFGGAFYCLHTISFNLWLRSGGYEVLCAGRTRRAGISQGLSHEGLRCAVSAICFSRRRAAARKASSSLRASSMRWGGMSIIDPEPDQHADVPEKPVPCPARLINAVFR